MSTYDKQGEPSTLRTRRYGDDAPIPFGRVHRFTDTDAVLEISLSGLESVMASTVYYVGHRGSYGAMELLAAMDIEGCDVLGDAGFVSSEPYLRRVIADYGVGLRSYWGRIRKYDPEVVSAVENRRVLLQEEYQVQQRLAKVRVASAEAAKLVRRGEFEPARKLLAEYAADENLPRSTTRLWSIIRNRCSDG
ncbi:MAG: hypothetical protein AAF417_23550 [Pseudomonadota bacterium]